MLTLQNAAATVSLPPYLLTRRFFPRHAGAPNQQRWVIGGHSGRMYADNAAALHDLLLREGRDVIWISADAGVTRMLEARGAKVRTRNSFAARRAIEQATVLAYSHGPSDLDHMLLKHCEVPALRVHLNHCLALIKASTPRTMAELPEDFVRAPVRDPFDYMLASSEREQRNLQRAFPGAGSRVRLGGGAHLDAFMRARNQLPQRSIAYFPTFRDTRQGQRQLEGVIRALTGNVRLRRWLEDDDQQLYILGHVNSGASYVHEASHARIHFPPTSELTQVLLHSSALISDYSGVICDYLALERPLVFFPFDRSSYVRARSLYVDYDRFVFGPQVEHVDALVELLVSGSYRDMKPFAERRRHWQREFFPCWEATYAERTLATIDALLAKRTGLACSA